MTKRQLEDLAEWTVTNDMVLEDLAMWDQIDTHAAKETRKKYDCGNDHEEFICDLGDRWDASKFVCPLCNACWSDGCFDLRTLTKDEWPNASDAERLR